MKRSNYIAAAALFVSFWCLYFSAMQFDRIKYLKSTAIENCAARYNPTSGEFEFINMCKERP